MDLSEFYAAEFGHSCDDVNCRYLFADEELSDLRREQCLVSDCRFDSSDPISSCEPLPTDSGDPFNMVGLNYKDKGRILARKESDKKLEVEGTKFPEELAEPDSFVRPNIILDCTDQDEAAEFTPDFFNYENMNGDGFESEGLTLRNEKNVAALWTAVKTWLNEDQRDKVKFIAANKLPKSIPLRHQLNSLDGEKIWSYSCAKLNREENLSLEELPHYDVRVTTIASELKASYSRDKIQGQDDDNVAAKQSNATSFFTTVNDIRKAFAAGKTDLNRFSGSC